MQRIVINTCHGGFDLSEAARELLTRFPPKSDRPDAGEGTET